MKKDLYVANNIDELNQLVQKDFKNFKPQKLYNSAEKLFQTGLAKLHDGDEEMAYIFFVRFNLIYEFLQTLRNDDGYTRKRLGNEFNSIKTQLDTLKLSLDERYGKNKELKLKLEENKTDSNICDKSKQLTQVRKTVSENFPSGFLSCTDLLKLIQSKCDLVIFDTRPADDYQQSHMKQSCCVNIPEDIIESGLSANVLGKDIPNESKEQWNRRWKFSLIILLDWSSTKDTITASKLSILKDILLNWDTASMNNNVPVVLNGGYLDWLQIYPMYCINPDVVHQVQNSVLNDLLDLDSINYPSAEESSPLRYLKPPSTRPTINRATKPLTAVFSRDVMNQEQEIGPKPSLDENESKIVNIIEVVQNKNLLESNNKTNNHVDVKNITNETIKVTENNNKEEIIKSLLKEAREKKSNVISAKNNIENKITKIPTVDRSIKPIKDRVTEPGLTGLSNFGTTCYMNSVIQCLSNTALLLSYFLNLTYLDELNKNQGTCGHFTETFANTLKKMWNCEYKAFLPKSLKKAVNAYAPRYKNSEHQDAHEFLITIINWIHEDLKRDIDRPLQVCWTPKERSWIEQTDGQYSIILETFCGQLKNVIGCDFCHKKKEKYEVFNNLSLALPSGDNCTLEQCLEQYFSRQPIMGYRCPQCKHEKQISQQTTIVSHPPILVILLKRFSECFSNNSLTFVRNNVKVRYPLENLTIFNTKYNLYGTVSHCGTLEKGHYWAICKNPRNNRWFKFDDDHVLDVEKNVALNPSEAYILFYETSGGRTLKGLLV